MAILRWAYCVINILSLSNKVFAIQIKGPTKLQHKVN